MSEAARDRLAQSRVIFAVAGSVSCVTVPHLLLWLKREVGVGCVDVLLTRSARRFLASDSIESITGRRCVTGWDDFDPGGAPHVTLGAQADLMVIAPATANTVGKLALGVADDVVTTTFLAADCPVLVAPVMNSVMWHKPSVMRNVAQLVQDGVEVVPPTSGRSLTQDVEEIGSMGDIRSVIARSLAASLAKSHRNGTGESSS